MSTAIIAITKNGFQLAKRYQVHFPEASVYSKYGHPSAGVKPIESRLAKLCASLFEQFDQLVFIMATGIVVRCIAPLLQHKSKDPAVVVVDEAGQFAISLLSGHLGGANQLTQRIADKTGAKAVITTASDTQGKQSIDMFAQAHGLKIKDWKKLTRLTAILVNGGKIHYENKTQWDIPTGKTKQSEADATVYISHKEERTEENSLTLFAPTLMLGIGCRKDKDSQVLQQFVEKELKRLKRIPQQVAQIVSVERKKEEAAILNLAKNWQVPTQFYSNDEIAQVEHLFEASDFVKQTLGVSCVSEPAAYLAGNGEGKFLLQKAKQDGMTLSVFELTCSFDI